MADLSQATPQAADLAAYVAHDEGVSRFAGEAARAALLRLAKIAVALDNFRKDVIEKNHSLFHATQDSAQTAQMTIERLQQWAPLVDAAVAWRQAFTKEALMRGPDEFIAAAKVLRGEVDKELERRSKRS